eukprot:m.126569 g.126569  ORF g.126569 m.126569 type:complete len:188 (-) comp14518_c0_seq15:711-1274(-)
MTTTKEFFDKNGYAVVEGFASEDECNNMMSRMAEILSQWVPKAGHSVFTTGKNQEQARGDYFLESADKVSVFLEAEAVTESGELKCEKHLAVNKVGHGLHVVEDVFREYSFSEKVKNLVKDLGWKDPVLPQSMYIFKQPGEVHFAYFLESSLRNWRRGYTSPGLNIFIHRTANHMLRTMACFRRCYS